LSVAFTKEESAETASETLLPDRTISPHPNLVTEAGFKALEAQLQEARVATPEQKEKVLALARDLPRVWHARTTHAKDRKRMLRLLIKDITVEKPQPKQLLVHIRWQGGACTHHSVPLPPSIADRKRYPAPLVDRVRNLAQSLPDAQIVDRLNQEGQVSALGKPFTLSMIRWIRHRYKIPAAKLMSSDELTVQQVAERFRVSIYVVYSWIEQGLLPARRLNPGMPYWITVREAEEQKLRDWLSNSHRLRTTSLKRD